MKQRKEIEVVTLMIRRFCKGKHGGRSGELCEECAELLDYVKLRRDKCPFGDDKLFCANCRIHCYKPQMRERVRSVMRYAGPRIVLRHPIIVMRHMTETKRQKRKLEKEALENVR